MSDWTLICMGKSLQRPRHHLWFNKYYWWFVFVLRNTKTGKSKKHWQNLKTADLETAMRRRDKILAALENAYGKETI